jgi:hypothetical protein
MWELIGITSFLLIGYWWDRSAATNAAVQALIVNRIGDCSFTLALMLIIIVLGTLDLDSLILLFNGSLNSLSIVNPIDSDWQYMLISWAGVFLVVAAFGKSAQFLLHAWLPLSMEGASSSLNITNNYYLNYNSFPFPFHGSKINLKNTMIRDSKGRFVGRNKIITLLSQELLEAITGDLLGDGHLRSHTKKNSNMPYGSAHMAFTFSVANLPLLNYLRYNVYASICTDTKPNPYPNINLPHHKGKKITQYTFTTRSLEELGKIRSFWYNQENKRCLPHNIYDLITFRSIAHWVATQGRRL